MDTAIRRMGMQIGDAGESSTPFRGALTNVRRGSIPEGSWLNQNFQLGDRAFIGMMTTEVRVECPDHWVFSMSSVFDEATLLLWNKDPDARYCCYRIDEAEGFFHALSDALADRADLVGFADCVYYPDDDVPLDSPLGCVHPALMKPGKTHGPQVEVRGFWLPRDRRQQIKPLDLVVPSLSKHCTIVAQL